MTQYKILITFKCWWNLYMSSIKRLCCQWPWVAFEYYFSYWHP